MFEVGQKVWDVAAGEGVVTYTDDIHSPYPVYVRFGEGRERTYSADGKYRVEDENPTLYPYPVEIVKKVTKPSINWEHVRDESKFLAQDANGNAWLYWEKPRLSEDHWVTTRGECAEAHSYASFSPGTCDWKDSLVERPKGV